LIFSPEKKLIDRADVGFPYQFEIDSFFGNKISIVFNSFDKNQKEIISKFKPSEFIRFRRNSSYNFNVSIRDFYGSATVPEKQVDSVGINTTSNSFLLYDKNQIMDTVAGNNFFIDKNNVLLKSNEKDGILLIKQYILKDVQFLFRNTN
jgi:hypothetical protein